MKNSLQFTRIALTFVLLAATLLPAAAQTTRRVTTAGNALADGSTWANAMTLQAALAASTMTGDQVWIAADTYKPHATDRTATFSVPAGVLVYGGFAGNEAALADRAGAATILSGDLLGDDGTRPAPPANAFNLTPEEDAALATYNASRDDNSNTVVIIAGADVTLDGLTITAGEGGNPADNNNGAGLFAGAGTAGATLVACTFTDNTAGGHGGGTFFNRVATLTACTFTGNEAGQQLSSGGGAYFFGTSTLTACTFTDNVANSGGGAYFFEAGTLTNCVLVGNSTLSSGGGIRFRSGGTVINSTLYNNTATAFVGGGIRVVFNPSNPFVLRNSILVGNTAANAASGHQVYVHNGNANEVSIQTNLIEGGAAGRVYQTPGSANITEANTVDAAAAAVFASTDANAANYLRLLATSPAVNVGNNEYLNNGTPADTDDDIETDAANEMRIQGGTVDLGAYESDIDTRTAQTIDFTSPDAGTIGTSIELEATGGGSGQPVMFAVTTETLPDGSAANAGEVATLDGDGTTLILIGEGMVLITATQAGDADYAAATQTQTITVRPPIVRRVTTAGNALADGSTWANAMTLQAALSNSSVGDQVWIAAGTYMPDATDRTATFSVPAGVLVYGGFAGTEAALADRTGGATILSGDLMRDDGTRPVQPAEGEDMTAYNAALAVYDATRDDNSNKVVTIAGDNVTLDGLIISGGQGDNSGAGLYSVFTNTTVVDCAFTSNTSNASSGGGGANFRGKATLTGCTFTGNTANGSGGGALFRGEATLTACTFIDNEADDGGGAIFGETATLTGCTFTGNTAVTRGGGAFFLGAATLTDCTFTDNSRNDRGRGLLDGVGGASFNGTATLTGCTFTGNTSNSFSGGASFRGAATLTGCTFTGNTANTVSGGANFRGAATLTGCTFTGNTANSGGGGGAYFSGETTLANCVVIGNRASDGGGLLFFSGGTVINSTFYNNTATSSRGGGILVGFRDTDTGTPGVQSNPFTLRNSILVGNTVTTADNAIYFTYSDPLTATDIEAVIANNLIGGGMADLGVGLFDADTDTYTEVPLADATNVALTNTIEESDATAVFASIMAIENDYLHLRAGSPAVNAGNNDYLNNGTPGNPDDDIETDVVGEMRIQGGTVDLGAYESAFQAHVLTFTLANTGMSGDVIPLTATVNSGLPVTYESSDMTVAVVRAAAGDRQELVLLAPGMATITASRGGGTTLEMLSMQQLPLLHNPSRCQQRCRPLCLRLLVTAYRVRV